MSYASSISKFFTAALVLGSIALFGAVLMMNLFLPSHVEWAWASTGVHAYIQKVKFLNPTTLDIVFSQNMVAGTTNTTAPYTVFAGGAQLALGTATATLQGDNKTVRLVVPNTAFSVRPSDSVVTLCEPNQNAPKDSTNDNIPQSTCGPVNITMPKSPHVVFSEIQIAGGTSTDEFIELYNTTATTQSLNNFRLAKMNQAGTTLTNLVANIGAQTIPARGYFLIAHTGYAGSPAANVTYSGVEVSPNETLLLYSDQGTTVIDMVGLRTSDFSAQAVVSEGPAAPNPAASGSLERKAQSSSTTASMAAGGADVTAGNGYDTNANDWDFITRATSNPQNASSAQETPPADTIPPGIDHAPIFKALQNADIVINAHAGDNATPTEALTVIVDYKRPGGGSSVDEFNENTDVTCSFVGGWDFKCTIPLTVVTAAGDIDYYLKVTDSAGNSATFPTGATSTGTIFNHIDVVASAGNNTISGNVKNTSAANINGANVKLKGTTISVVTGVAGDFSLGQVFDGCWDIEASAPGYNFSSIAGICISGGATASGNQFNLSPAFGGGSTGGDITPPTVMGSAPPDGMNNAPFNIAWSNSPTFPAAPGQFPIFVNFSEPMDPSTFSTSSVILSTDGTNSIAATPTLLYNAAANQLFVYSSTLLTKGVKHVLILKNTITDANHNPLSGNLSGGGHIISFTTQVDTTSFTAGSTAIKPPFILGTSPKGGSFDVALNSKIQVAFSEAMDPASINLTNTTTGNFRFASVTGTPPSISETPLPISVALDTATSTGASITPTAVLSANTHYVLKILGGAKSQKGVTLAPPGQETSPMFFADFNTGTTSDTTAPTMVGSSLETFKNSAGAIVSVPTSHIIMVGASENIDPATVTATTVKLLLGTTSVAGDVSYDQMTKSIFFAPKVPLNLSTTYTFKVVGGSFGVKDIAGNALAADASFEYTTTATADTGAPKVTSAEGDDFKIAIHFNEAMNQKNLGETGYANSVLNIANYAVKQGPAGTDFSTGGTAVSLTGKTVRYESARTTAVIEGLALTQGNQFQVVVTGVKDLGGNAISTAGSAPFTDNASVGTCSATFFQGGGTFTGMGGGGGGTIGGGMDFSTQGTKPIGVFPMSMMAGQTSMYMVNIPLTTAIPASGKIILTFPTGFDVTNAAMAAQSPVNSDINGPGTGTVTVASVAKDAVAGTITITLGSVATQATDFLRFDLEQIKNSPVASDFTSSGNTVKITTKSATGLVLENLTSMPFFLQPKGNFTLTGTITAAGAGSGTMKVFLMVPGSGPTEATSTTFSSGTATYTFSSLNAGEYDMMTLPNVTLGSTDYAGLMPPRHVSVNNTACGGTTCTQNFTITNASTGAGLTVQISGTFASGGESIDIFAGSFGGAFGGATMGGKFVVKTISLAGTVTNNVSTIFLPSLGDWSVGMGPAMPKTMFNMAPITMPSWMPPQPVPVNVSGSLGSPTWKETSGTANNGIVGFTITGATSEIRGKVVDSSGTGLNDVEVFSFKSEGFGMPAHARTKSDGTFVLLTETLSAGQESVYGIGAWKQGMPPIPDQSVVIKANNAANDAADGNTTADVYIGGKLVTTANPFLIKFVVSSTTISGRVTDGGNPAYPLGNIPINAYNTATGGSVHSQSDSSGDYILYVSPGTWKIEAFSHEYGRLTYPLNNSTVVVTSPCSSQICTNVDLKPEVSSTSMGTISGTVTLEGTGVEGAEVWAEGSATTFGNFGVHTRTEASGTYRLKVQPGTYTVHVWVNGYGEFTSNTGVTVAAGATVTSNFTVASSSLATVTVNVTLNSLSTSTKAFVGVFSPATKVGGHSEIADITVGSGSAVATLKIPAGSGYEAHLFVDGFGDIRPNSPDNTTFTLTGGAGKTLTFAIPAASSRVTISGTVTAGASNIKDAFVWANNPSVGFQTSTKTASNGTYTMVVPQGTYDIGVNKPGYSTPAPSKGVDLTAVTTRTQDFALTDLTAGGLQISGTVKNSSSVALANSWVFAEKVTSLTNFTPIGGETETIADASGNYALSVGAGFWLLHAVAEGYSETKYLVGTTVTVLQVTSTSLSGKDFTLNAIANFTAKKPRVEEITPSEGGVIDDTANTGVKIIIPANALGTDTTAARVVIKETTQIRDTETRQPLGDIAPDIKVYSSTGSEIKTFNTPVTVQVTYSESKIPAGLAETSLKLAFYNNEAGQYEDIPTVQDTTNNTLTGSISHFSLIPPTTSGGAVPPNAPGTPSVTAYQFGPGLTVSWTAATKANSGDPNIAGYEVYRSTSATGTFGNVSGDSFSTGSFNSATLVAGTSYNDTSAANGVTYYYKAAAFNVNGDNSASSAASGGLSWTAGGGGSIAPSPSPSPGGGGGIIPTPPPPPAPTVKPEVKKEEPVVTSEKEKLIAGVVKQIAELQAKLAELVKAQPVLAQPPTTLTKTIAYGTRNNPQIQALQEFLTKEGVYTGPITGNFFGLTRAAIKKFQEKYSDEILKPFGLKEGTGILGVKTRQKLNELMAK